MQLPLFDLPIPVFSQDLTTCLSRPTLLCRYLFLPDVLAPVSRRPPRIKGMLSLRSELCRRSRFAKVVISLGSGRHKQSRKENDLSNCGRAPLAHKPTKCCRAGFRCHACLLTICWIPPKAFQNVQGAKFAIGFPNLPIRPNATSQAWSQTLWVPNTSWALLRHPWQSKDGRSITLHPH